MEIPYIYLSFCADNPAAGRWDQAWIQRILNQEEWKIPWGVKFYEHDFELGDPAGPMDGAVIVFPCGHYKEHCGTETAIERLQSLVNFLPWSVVIATSDEGSTFPWHRFNKPKTCRLWVMTPRPECSYPPGSFFIGEGSPYSAAEFEAWAHTDWVKKWDVFFSGQINHERREDLADALLPMEIMSNRRVFFNPTGGFTEGFGRDEYLELMTQASIVPCPAGPVTQDSFRFYEALEAQAIPIADARRPGRLDVGYWQMLFDWVPAEVRNWNDLPNVVQLIDENPKLPAKTSAWWQQQKRRMAYQLDDDVRAVTPTAWVERSSDQVTALLMTSPSPLHPATDITRGTLDSVRERLPNAEILIGIDGLRPTEMHRQTPYYEYARRLCAETNPMVNVCPFVFDEHQHQSGMVRRLLEEVHTDYVLFMEHDTPLCGEIDFDECVEMMEKYELGILRFTHEAGVLAEHAHLFLEVEPPPGQKFVRTIQYSARPHLIRTDKLRDLMATYFGKSKTFLEDTLYGALQYLPDDDIAGRARRVAIWRRHRMAVYAPEGTWKRSEHTDGRRGDPKLPTWIEYEGDRPEGGPPEGEMIV